jgi:hypothetical protein
VANPRLQIIGVLITLHDQRTNISKDVVDRISKVFGPKVFKTVISKSVKLEESPAYKESIFTYAGGSIETCCSVAWMALTIDALRLTGDPTVADELELTLWNQALAAQHPSGHGESLEHRDRVAAPGEVDARCVSSTTGHSDSASRSTTRAPRRRASTGSASAT